MRDTVKPLIAGILLLFGALVLDLLGSSLQSVPVLIFSFVLAIAGAVIAIRGVVDYLAGRS